MDGQWWIKIAGGITGPYSAEQVAAGVWLHKFTKMHKISTDRREWILIADSEFWPPLSSSPRPVEPTSKIRKKPRFAPVGIPIDDMEEGNISARRDDFEARRNETAGRQTTRTSMSPAPAASVKKAAIIAAAATTTVLVGLWLVLSICLKQGLPWSNATSSADGRATCPKDAAYFETVKKRVAIVRGKNVAGTAFLVKMDGKRYIVTNDHMVRGETIPEMLLVDGTRLQPGAMQIARDRDLVRFEISGDEDAFELAGRTPNNNDEVWIYGNSMGDGVITTLRGFVTGVGDKELKTNAEIVGGNSGGPVVGADGKVYAVAAFLKAGDDGTDWRTRNTSFDSVRRFALRIDGASWLDTDKRKYESDCVKLENARTYWNFLFPYLFCSMASVEEQKELKLVHLDIDKKQFSRDDEGWHEMLMAVSSAYERRNKVWSKWLGLCADRAALIKKLNAHIESRELSREDAEKELAAFDKEEGTDALWEKVKEKYRDFHAKRKEALLMLRDFMRKNDWNPLMRHGYGRENKEFSVDWYLDVIQYFIDQNNQELSNLNKGFKTMEGNDDDE